MSQFRLLVKKAHTSRWLPLSKCSSSCCNPSTAVEEDPRTIKRHQLIDRIIRVDHAGELGADRIYAGQLFILSNTGVGPTIKNFFTKNFNINMKSFEELRLRILAAVDYVELVLAFGFINCHQAFIFKHMWEQEKEHLQTFERLIPKYRVRPTALLPLWNVAGFVLGASTALLGKESAMACTVAVEEVIADHYNNQIREMIEDNPVENKELLEVVKKFRDDEIEHHDTGLEHDALKAPFYSVLKQAIQLGCKGAIWISERI